MLALILCEVQWGNRGHLLTAELHKLFVCSSTMSCCTLLPRWEAFVSTYSRCMNNRLGINVTFMSYSYILLACNVQANSLMWSILKPLSSFMIYGPISYGIFWQCGRPICLWIHLDRPKPSGQRIMWHSALRQEMINRIFKCNCSYFKDNIPLSSFKCSCFTTR